MPRPRGRRTDRRRPCPIPGDAPRSGGGHALAPSGSPDPQYPPGPPGATAFPKDVPQINPRARHGDKEPGLCDQDIKDVDYPGHCGLVWAPQGRKDVRQLEQGERRAFKVGLEPFGSEERLRKLGLPSPE
ncbi:hypothetical protein TURU_015344 [Turdus rufiventris]|nr:hypothetical protein TURU_015344 [Turdus rufiventris]